MIAFATGTLAKYPAPIGMHISTYQNFSAAVISARPKSAIAFLAGIFAKYAGAETDVHQDVPELFGGGEARLAQQLRNGDLRPAVDGGLLLRGLRDGLVLGRLLGWLELRLPGWREFLRLRRLALELRRRRWELHSRVLSPRAEAAGLCVTRSVFP